VWKLRRVEREQAAALHLDRVPRLPFAEDGVEPVDLAGGDADVERFRD